MNNFKTVMKILLPLLVLAAAGMVAFKLVSMKQAPPKVEREYKGPLVNVAPAARSDVRIEVKAFGTVRPRRQVDITPQIQGKVVEVSPNLVGSPYCGIFRASPQNSSL